MAGVTGVDLKTKRVTRGCDQKYINAIFKRLRAGDIVSIEVRGHLPKGQSGRVLFFVEYVERKRYMGNIGMLCHPVEKGISGYYEDDLGEQGGRRFALFDDIMGLNLVVSRDKNPCAYYAIRKVIADRNYFKKQIEAHNILAPHRYKIKI